MTVVSIDLFWPFFMPFLYNGVYFRPAQVSTLSFPPTHILSAQSIFLHAQTQ